MVTTITLTVLHRVIHSMWANLWSTLGLPRDVRVECWPAKPSNRALLY